MMSNEEYKKFECQVYKKKGDCIFVKFGSLPYKYYRISDLKFREITFEDLESKCKDEPEASQPPEKKDASK